MKVVVDNDILFKGACYGLLSDLTSTICPDSGRIGILGSARFVVTKRLDKAKLNQNRAMAQKTFLTFLQVANKLEPTVSEQRLAADLELASQRCRLHLDGGESLLIAILVERAIPLLATGDKKAIVSMEVLIDLVPKLLQILGKIVCLEQIFVAALEKYGWDKMRSAVCSEPQVDKALEACFSCLAESGSAMTAAEGLKSYVNALRHDAGRVLSP